VIGLVVALLVAAVRRVGTRVLDLRPRLGTGPSLLLGGLAVGLLTLAVDSAGGVYDDVMFSGQTTLPLLLGTSSGMLLALIVLAKALAYAISLGAGFRGGPVFPAIFLGTGCALIIGQPFGMSTTAALAIGAACGMAAFTRLIFSSVIFVLLFEGSAGTAAIPAAVLAAATAWVVGKFLDARVAATEEDADAAAGAPGSSTA
jgi:H+/Cl- antiporter ClcA